MHRSIISLAEQKPQSIIFQRLSSYMSRRCSRCGTLRLSQAFDIILKTAKGCWRCQLNAKLVKFVLTALLADSGLRKADLCQLLSISLYRRIILAIVSGVAAFGFSTPQPTGVPLAVVWNFTNKCNLHCAHCYQDAGKQASQELSTEEALRVVEELAQSGVAALSFSGGEPLARDDFFKVAQHASELGFSLSLSTNGTLINREIVKHLLDVDMETVAISIDSLTSSFHDDFRGTPGSWQRAWDGVRACVAGAEDGRHFKEVIVNTTLTTQSIHDIAKIYHMARDAGVTRYYVSRILPVGRGTRVLSALDVSPEDRKGVLEYLAQQCLKAIKNRQNPKCLARGMTYYARECFEQSDGRFFPVSEIVTGLEAAHRARFSNRLAELVHQLGKKAGGCATGITYCGISPEGDVLPCAPLSDFPLANLRERSFRDIWHNHPVFRYLRQRTHLKGKCGSCEYQRICGGCRATAYGHTGDFLAADPTCPFPD